MRTNKPKLTLKGFQMSILYCCECIRINGKCGQTWTLTSSMRSAIERHFTLVSTLGIYRWFEIHGRLLSAKDLAQMQYSQKRLVMDFYLQFF